MTIYLLPGLRQCDKAVLALSSGRLGGSEFEARSAHLSRSRKPIEKRGGSGSVALRRRNLTAACASTKIADCLRLRTWLCSLAVFAVAFVATPATAALTCTVMQANIAFGNINVLPGTAVNVSGTISISCSGGAASTQYRFCTNIEAGPDVSGSQRRMASGANRLVFDLYTNSGRTILWGSWASGFDTAGSQNDFTTNGSGNLNQTITVFGRVFAAQQTASPGAYSEAFAGGSATTLRYGSTSAAGVNCPTGANIATAASWSATATVLTSCSISATNLAFGAAGVLAANVDATNTVTPRCTNGTPYNVGLNAGTGTGATVANRKMTSGANTVTYSLYSNSGRTALWGNTIGTNTVTGTGSGASQALTVYGRIPPQTTPPPAIYNDTIVATVTY